MIATYDGTDKLRQCATDKERGSKDFGMSLMDGPSNGGRPQRTRKANRKALETPEVKCDSNIKGNANMASSATVFQFWNFFLVLLVQTS